MAIGCVSPTPLPKSMPLPTAHTSFAASALTEVRPSGGPPGFGLGTTFQAEPFHSTVAVAFPPLLVPTAHATAGLALETDPRLIPGSVADVVHADPS
jgi:hypothetical protein